jgi:hypothetical protein
MQFTRREVLAGSAAAVMAARVVRPAFGAAREKLPVAAVVTEYRPVSHADVIVGKVLEGWRQDGGDGPGLKLVSLYVDQTPPSDISRKLAEKHGFRLAKTIDEAITLGGDKVAVAGVLSIGEHGNYPATADTGQVQYPRRRFFDEIVAAFRRGGKTVPVFNDKHLGYRWEDAKHMVDVAQEQKFPLMAGSSISVAWRYPAVELPRDCEIEGALTLGYGGLEAYGFHALEAHQCLIENRRGGETGIAAVQAVAGEGIAAAEKSGRWSKELLAAALKSLPGPPRDIEKWKMTDSAGYLLEHCDGLKSAVLMANGLTDQFCSAIKIKGRPEPLAIWFKLQEGPPFGHFAYLLRAIDEMVHSGKPPYPVERTLLTTGILDRAMHSLAEKNVRLETPELDFAYKPANWPFANRDDSPLKLPND